MLLGLDPHWRAVYGRAGDQGSSTTLIAPATRSPATRNASGASSSPNRWCTSASTTSGRSASNVAAASNSARDGPWSMPVHRGRHEANLLGQERGADGHRLPVGGDRHDGAAGPHPLDRVVERTLRSRRVHDRRRTRSPRRAPAPRSSPARALVRVARREVDVETACPRPRRPRQDRSTRRRSRGRGHRARPPPGAPPACRPRAARPARPPTGRSLPAGARRQRRSTITSSARPPSSDTPWSRAPPVRHRLVSPARHRSQVPHHALGCTATGVPSSSTPANSWPSVTGRFQAARCRSDAQIPQERTRTRTGSVACAGAVTSTSTTATPPSPDARTARTPGVLQARGREARAPTPLRCGRSSNGLGVERRWRISVSTARWRSSPARAAASAASTRCCSPAGARMVVVNDLGGSVDGTGGDAGPGQQVVDEIKAAGGEAVPDTNSRGHARGRRGHRADRARRLRTRRHRHQQRRHPARQDVPQHDARPGRPGASTCTSRARSTSPSRRGCTCASRPTAASSSPRRRPASSATSARPTTAPPRWASSASPTCSPRRASATTSRPTPSPRSASTRMTERSSATSWPTSSRPGSCHRSWPGWRTRTARSRARSTPSAAGASPASSSAEGPGYSSTDAPLTVEDVRDHFDEIERTDDFTLMRNATDELRVVAKLLG